MNKKAITSEAVYAILILIAIVIIASIFMVPIISKWIKPPIAFVEEKLGLMTPTGTTLNQMQVYVGVLLSDNVINAIDGSDWAAGVKKGNIKLSKVDLQYDKLNENDKIEEYYNWANYRINILQNDPKTSTDDWTKLNDMNTQLKFAHDYAIARHNYYTSLEEPVTKYVSDADYLQNFDKAKANLAKLSSLNAEMQNIVNTAPKDYSVYAKAAALLNDIQDPNNCKLSPKNCYMVATICFMKNDGKEGTCTPCIQFNDCSNYFPVPEVCAGEKIGNSCQYLKKIACKWDGINNKCANYYECDKQLSITACLNTPECFPVYKEETTLPEFKECKDCNSAECINYGGYTEVTCDYIISRCKKNCQNTADGCVAKP